MGVRTPDVAPYRTIDQAADQLKVSRKTLQNWIRAGFIHKYKIPGDRHTYIDVAEVREYRKPHRRDEPPSVGGGSPDSSAPIGAQLSCPGCGAHSTPGKAACWRCGRALGTA